VHHAELAPDVRKGASLPVRECVREARAGSGVQIEADEGVGLSRALQTGRLRAKATARWHGLLQLERRPC
jgi:hypothetical protein